MWAPQDLGERGIRPRAQALPGAASGEITHADAGSRLAAGPRLKGSGAVWRGAQGRVRASPTPDSNGHAGPLPNAPTTARHVAGRSRTSTAGRIPRGLSSSSASTSASAPASASASASSPASPAASSCSSGRPASSRSIRFPLGHRGVVAELQGRDLAHGEDLAQVPVEEAAGGLEPPARLLDGRLVAEDGEVDPGQGEIAGDVDPGDGGQLVDPRVLELPPLDEGGDLLWIT